jgi:hypothetical protein
MTLRLTIEIDEVPPALAQEIVRVFERLQVEPRDDVQSHAETDDWWLGSGRIETLLELLTDGSLVALEAIANGAPETRIEDVQARVREAEPKAVDVNVYGGILSSFGHAKNRMGAPKRIFEVDEYRRVYVIDESVARRALEAMTRMRRHRG